MKPAFPTEGFHAFIICEVRPLVTIGLKNESRRLLRPPLPVIIPDVIYRDAIGGLMVGGSRTAQTAVLDWVRYNDDVVHVVPTQAGMMHDMLFKGHPSRAEAAVIETVDSFYAGSADQRAILIFDDRATLSKRTDSRMPFASVGDFIDIGRGRYANTLVRTGVSA